jgi:Hemerythrin HHE cation binding domain
MLSPARQRLSDDHRAVHDVLKQVLTALPNKDVAASYAKLDLLWARLAVHIRAEHLHLFPAVINRLTGSINHAEAPDLSEAQAIVNKLRADHDFFMREFARAVGILGELKRLPDSADSETSFTSVHDAVLEVEKQLANHNELEENQIYRWASTILTEQEQMDLAMRINAELENRPSRFSVEAWANDL